MNYKLFNAARNKSTMNYQEGRFDMELESDVNQSSNGHKMRSTSCPRHSHNEHIRPTSLQNIHLRNTAASTVSHMFHFYHKFILFIIDFCIERLK